MQRLNDAAFASSCHVVIITTKFGEFLPNRLGGDSVTDEQRDGRTDKLQSAIFSEINSIIVHLNDTPEIIARNVC